MAEKLKTRASEVAYCGGYRRKCYWNDGEIQEPAKRLLDLVRGHSGVATWVNEKGGDSKATAKGLEILSKVSAVSTAKAAEAGGAVQFANAALKKV